MKKLILILFLAFTSQAWAAVGPEQLIKDTTDQVLSDIKENSAKYRDQPALLNELVDQVVLPHFDFGAMTNLALGRYKKKVTPDQKPAIVEEFRTLLVRTYGSALLEYNDQSLVYLPMEGSEADGKVTVRTEIQQEGGFPIPINYRLRFVKEKWKVFDISVDGVSLVTNYRSSFARAIKKNGVEGLIETLKARNSGE
ncbi:MAG: ABC transporter substrate-binding protein [Pseudomonadota bacterium]